MPSSAGFSSTLTVYAISFRMFEQVIEGDAEESRTEVVSGAAASKYSKISALLLFLVSL